MRSVDCCLNYGYQDNKPASTAIENDEHDNLSLISANENTDTSQTLVVFEYSPWYSTEYFLNQYSGFWNTILQFQYSKIDLLCYSLGVLKHVRDGYGKK